MQIVLFFSDCAGLEPMEEYLGENYDVTIGDITIETETGLTYFTLIKHFTY